MQKTKQNQDVFVVAILFTLSYLLREQDVISEQGEYSLKIVKRTGCNKRIGWGKFSQVVKQTGCFKQAKTGKQHQNLSLK